MGPENLPGVAADDRRQLVEISDEDHLHAAEGQRLVRAVQAQEFIHTVEEISPHHGDLINEDRFQLLVDILFLIPAPALYGRGDDVWFEPEKGMDRLPAHIDCRHTRRRQNDDGLFRVIAEIAEEGGLPRAGPPGDEDMPT